MCEQTLPCQCPPLEHFLFFFHVSQTAHLHISRQFFVRKQAQAIILTATCTMHDVGIRCVDLGHVTFPTALYLQRFLVSFNRGVLRLCCRFTGKTVVSIDVMRSCPWFQRYSPKNVNIGTSWSVCQLLGCWKRAARSAAAPLLTVACIAAWNQTFTSEVYHCRSGSSVLPLHADLPCKNLRRLQ